MRYSGSVVRIPEQARCGPWWHSGSERVLCCSVDGAILARGSCMSSRISQCSKLTYCVVPTIVSLVLDCLLCGPVRRLR